MPRVDALATPLPAHRCDQSDIRNEMAHVCRGDRAMERLLPLFDRTGVDTRYFVRPPKWYSDGPSFETRNAVYAESAIELAEEAARACLDRSGIGPDAIDHIFFVTTTGLMTPSLDARLVSRLGLRSDIRRLPLFGLGCAAGDRRSRSTAVERTAGHGGTADLKRVRICANISVAGALS
jgi:alkylresorcinol/alkylpyrone synthase